MKLTLNSEIRKYLVVLVAVMASTLLAFGNDLPQRPSPAHLVNDMAGLFNATDANDLERVLVDFNNATSTQIAVVTIADLEGYDAGDFAFRLAEEWGVGQKGRNNGILILIKPKTADSRGQAYIATGYGLEGVVPDAVARQIVDNEMIPQFKSNQYFSGVVAGVKVLMELTRGEYTADAYVKRTSNRVSNIAAIFILIIVILLLTLSRRADKIRSSSVGGSLPFWVLLSMMGSGAGRHGGHYGNFTSGGGGFGGGGFGGFGGGSFGGGGAGGSW
jgi:uncharacterized protein